LWLGFVQKGTILAYNRVGELSYSVYQEGVGKKLDGGGQDGTVPS
jgi:hypothetical protein